MKRTRFTPILVCLFALLALAAVAGCSQPQITLPALELPGDGNPAAEMNAAIEAEKRAKHEEELKQPFYALVLGGDTRTNTLDGDAAKDDNYNRGYSDTIMLVRVNPGNGRFTIVSIPRDTAVVRDGKPGKINDFMQFDGSDATVAYIEEATGVDIKYYFVTDFARYAKLINAVGGVDVDVPIELSCGDPIEDRDVTLQPGEKHLDGVEALVFARTRKVYGDETDGCRQIQDRKVVTSLLQAAAKSDEQAAALVAALLANTDTNIPAEDLEFYARHFRENAGNLSIVCGTMPYSGGINPDTERWEVPLDSATWAQMVKLMEDEGDPTSLVALPEVWAAE